AAEHEGPQNKQEKKLNQLYIEAAQREIDQLEIKKQGQITQNRNIHKDTIITTRLNSMKTNYKYVSQLMKQQTDKHIQKIKSVTNKKIYEAETAENKKTYLYKVISVLTETKDAILWKNRNLVKDIEEDYEYATNTALNLDRKDFEEMQEWEQ
ncbi:31016_t:CDS:2, partial [Racocetra persica]